MRSRGPGGCVVSSGAWGSLDVASAVALLCARERVDVDPDGSCASGRVERLRGLCAVVRDWDAVVRRASELLVVPLVHRHLRQVAGDVVPEVAFVALAGAARGAVLRNLRVAELHLRLSRDVLGPSGVRHVFLKGTTLAHRFYEDPSLRVARDVDVLVSRGDLRGVAHALRECGFRARHAVFGSDDGIAFAADVLGEVQWVSPDGVLVEVHSRLMLEEGRLPTGRLLADPDHVDVAGVGLPMLREPEAVAHLCLHHTRSGWTHLHCVADLDAVLRATGADPAALVASARTLGFGRVVAASLGLHRMLAASDPAAVPVRQVSGGAGDAEDVRLAGVLREVCLAGLARTDVSYRLRPSAAVARRARRVALADLGLPRRARVRMRDVFGRFSRQGADFVRLPLPAGWHWVYFVLRPLLRLVHGSFEPAPARR